MTNVVHKSPSSTQAEKDITACIQYLKSLSQKSEGLYYVEHMLLAPPYQGNHFGFVIKAETASGEQLVFKQYQLENYKKRNKWVKLIADNIGHNECLQFQVNRVEDKYVIRILDDEGSIVAQSEKKYEQEEEAKKLIEENSDTTEQGNVMNLCLDDITFISNYGDKLDEDESFFSFQMSFVLPAWPVRFQDTNFRSKFNSLLYEQAPAHIAHNSYWLDIEEIAAFEENYGDWKFYLSKEGAVEERLKQAYKLINKIKSYAI